MLADGFLIGAALAAALTGFAEDFGTTFSFDGAAGFADLATVRTADRELLAATPTADLLADFPAALDALTAAPRLDVLPDADRTAPVEALTAVLTAGRLADRAARGGLERDAPDGAPVRAAPAPGRPIPRLLVAEAAAERVDDLLSEFLLRTPSPFRRPLARRCSPDVRPYAWASRTYRGAAIAGP